MLPPYRYSRACVEKPSAECRGSLRELRATPVGENSHPERASKSDTPWTGVTILLSYRHENSIYGKRDTRDRRPRNDQSAMIPRCSAAVAASVRSFTLSFSRTWLTCSLT